MKEQVLVIGGAGYIGSHMVKRLIDENIDVLVLDNYSIGHQQLVSGVKQIERRPGDHAVLVSDAK